jgi:hypothetical protein
MNISYTNTTSFNRYIYSLVTTEEGFDLEIFENSVFHPGFVEGTTYETPWGSNSYKKIKTISFNYNYLLEQNVITDKAILTPTVNGDDSSWTNITKETFVSKDSIAKYYREKILPNNILSGKFLVYVPLKSSSEYYIHCLSNIAGYPLMVDGVPIEQDKEIISTEKDGLQYILQDKFFYTFQLDFQEQVPAGQEVAASISLRKHSGELVAKSCEAYLESTGGILPKNRVDIIDGIAHFNILTTGLVPGDTVRIKAGWKYWTGETEKVLTII